MTSSEELEQVDLIVENVAFRRLGCLAHGIKLVIKLAYNGKYHGLLLKTRGLVGKIVDKNGTTVISNCSTRWNSSYFMV